MTRAVVIKTVGDKDIGAAIAAGLTANTSRKITPGQRSAMAQKREHQKQKLAQFRAAALAEHEWWEVPVALVFASLIAVKSGVCAAVDFTAGTPGKTGKFFRKLYKIALKDSHFPWFGLIGLCLAWGLTGALICKIVIAMKYFW